MRQCLDDPGSPTPGGTIAGLDPQYRDVAFGATFDGAPGVMATVASVNEAEAAAVRVKDVTATGFRAKLREAEFPDTAGHVEETVNWVAMDFGFSGPGDPFGWEVLDESATSGFSSAATLPPA